MQNGGMNLVSKDMIFKFFQKTAYREGLMQLLIS